MTRSLFLFLILLSANVNAAIYRQGDSVNLTGRYVENIFVAGTDVSINVQTHDDIYVAGANVKFDSGSVSELVGAGRQLLINNVHIKDDVIVAGGEIDIGPETTIVGSLTAAGGSVRIGASVGEDAIVAGGKVILSGSINKDIKIYAKKLVISPTAVIRGNLVYAAESAEISSEAKIQGQTIVQAYEDHKSKAAKPAVIFGVLFLLGLVLLPAIFAGIIPKTVSYASVRIFNNIWESLGKGVVFTILFPIVWIMLLASGVGLPLAVALFFLLGLFKVAVWTVGSFTLGQFINNYFPSSQKTLNRPRVFLLTLMGSAVIAALTFIPFLGWALLIVLFLASAGAAISHLQKYLSES